MNKLDIEIKLKRDWSLNRILYFHIWDGHFKMWGFEVQVHYNMGEPYYNILFYWSKIMKDIKKLRTVMKMDLKKDEVFKILSEKIYEKLQKGYVPIYRNQYTEYTNGTVRQSEFIKFINGKQII